MYNAPIDFVVVIVVSKNGMVLVTPCPPWLDLVNPAGAFLLVFGFFCCYPFSDKLFYSGCHRAA